MNKFKCPYYANCSFADDDCLNITNEVIECCDLYKTYLYLSEVAEDEARIKEMEGV